MELEVIADTRKITVYQHIH